MTILSTLLGSTFVGAQGPAGSISIGTTTTVNPNVNPSVSNVGTTAVADFRFSLPRAPVVSVGTTTTVTPVNSASVTPTTTNGDVSLAFSIPRGASTNLDTPSLVVVNPNVSPSMSAWSTNGDTYIQFSIPRASAVSVGTVTTGAAGSSASVTNVGTNGDTVLNFTIPRGDAGTVTATSTDSFSNKTISGADNTIKANETMTLALSDEATSITTGTNKLKFRAPFAMTLYQIPRASLSTASTSGIPTVDINAAGVSILSTKLTIDANETTSTTAATAAVLSNTSIADDAEITFDIDVAGTGAKGLKVTLYYRRT